MNESTSIEKIRKAAVKEFSQYGFDGARIDRIARTAKINKAMIYYHFKGKEALYENILTGVVTSIYNRISELIPDTPKSEKEVSDLIRGYASFIATIDELYIKIMIREIVSGGKYFKKITIPILLEPVMKRVTAMFRIGQKNGLFAEIDPVFTMIQLVGSIVFYNMLRITMKDTVLAEVAFKDKLIERYSENVITIYSQGIYKHKR